MSVSIDTCFRTPGKEGEGYFFKDQNYLRMWWKPGTSEERLVFGPAEIEREWKNIREAGFETIDAVLPSVQSPEKVYVFSGDRYIRFSFVPGSKEETKIVGPRPISEGWPSLREAGFNRVDAVIPIPSTSEGYEETAYIFSGQQYVLVKYNPGTTKEELIVRPTEITQNWKVLREAGFRTVDAFMPNSMRNNEVDVYAFRDTKYVRFVFTPLSSKEESIYGPAGISENWATLRKLV